ncbi:MAG: 23S rRNA (adenine(2503)-C(2))-methyltransferase RlmN [Lachnospiraceae bacterium]|nr:23S rRNA (adenine(2503)-C(2))-methyltransferase RlmN [Lachnospiraceae bacterium]
MDIMSLNINELTAFCKEQGLPVFRAKQLYEWMHKKLVSSVDEMSNIPKNIRDMLREDYVSLAVLERYISKLDGTNKFLFGLKDGNVVESVWMPYEHGNSVCISSQVGCRMGCRFCASAIGGLTRNLAPSEMLGQIYAIQRLTGERVSHVVVMGTGEPFDNYDNLIHFLHMISDEHGLNISQRNITVSTCGIVPKIYALAEEGLSITLAISLHAPTDEERKNLMPIANQYTIGELLEAAGDYFAKTKRRVTFEYSLVAGENDSEAHADKLAELLSGMSCHVNLIPINPIKERNFTHSDKKSIDNFKFVLEKNHINVTIRRGMGRDINAACGQLRKKYISG